jgi:hypothetical protein
MRVKQFEAKAEPRSMSRTMLCLFTAGVLAVVSVGVMIVRCQALGDEVNLPLDGGAWKVTLVVTGKSSPDARLTTAAPLEIGKQHLLREICHSSEFSARPSEARQPGRRQLVWAQRPAAEEGWFRAHYECWCTTNMSRPTAAMIELTGMLMAAPSPGQYLASEPGVESDDPEIAALARRLTAGLARGSDQAEVLFQFVAGQIGAEPTVAGTPATARECLEAHSGDARAQGRLLAALLRNRGIPARLVTGLALDQGPQQTAHVWVEAWLREHWLPMCPFYNRYGRVPQSYLAFAVGDLPLVRARNVRNLDYGFLIERLAPGTAGQDAEPTPLHRLLSWCSFHSLPPAEQHLVEFLLLLPVAALIVCLFRNIIGIGSFGTFAPALLGLAFRELHSLPGMLVFVSIVLTGWLLRRFLDRYHLLQVPRMAVLLSLVVLVLIAGIVLAAHRNLPATRYIPLFPIVILVGMIERFWTLEVEDGTSASFRTLLATLFIAVTISLLLSFRAVVTQLFRYPETLGLVMAAQLLIGRYTGYRLTELYRFRDFLETEEEQVPVGHHVMSMKVPVQRR